MHNIAYGYDFAIGMAMEKESREKRQISLATSIARAAFETEQMINGIESGGIEPPDTISSDFARVIQPDFVEVTITHRHPAVGGLSDRTYHYTDTKDHNDIYLVILNKSRFPRILKNQDTDFLGLASHGYDDKTYDMYQVAYDLARGAYSAEHIKNADVIAEIKNFYQKIMDIYPVRRSASIVSLLNENTKSPI